MLFNGEAHVAIAFFTGHFPPKPGRGLKSAAARAIGEFHFRNYETGVSASINIQLDKQIFPRNFVAHLSQSSTHRARPQRCELFRGQLDLAFFAVAVATHLERKRRNVASLSKADLSAGPFRCQIALLDNEASPPFQVVRHPSDQKFSLNLAIVLRSIVPSHKVHIVNAMRSVSRLSRVAVSAGFEECSH